MALPGGGRPAFLDDLRQYHENERQWIARREFLARHMHLYPGHKLDQLIALSMVWSNIVFIGNRYGEQLTQKVHQMGEGIDIGEMPSYELVPGAVKRPSSTNDDGQPLKKKFGPRPRFEPLRFVSSTVEEDKSFLETNRNMDRPTVHDHFQTPDIQPRASDLCFPPIPDIQPQESDLCFPPNDFLNAEDCNEMDLDSSPYICDTNATDDDDDDDKKNDFGQYMKEMEQSYSAMFESHNSSLGKDFRSKVLDSWQDLNKQGRKGIGFIKPPKKSGCPGNKQNAGHTSTGRKIHSLDTQSFFNQLSSIVKQNMASYKATANKPVSFNFLLSRSIQACKTNPEYIYAIPKNLPRDHYRRFVAQRCTFVCEVRCQNVYLASGSSTSKNRARDKAAELALRLLLAPSLEITSVKRKCGNGYRDDLVVFSPEAGLKEPPPFINQEEAAKTDDPHRPEQPSAVATPSRPLSDFVIVDRSLDAICILQMSSDGNKMAVEYKYDAMPNNVWRCCVYVEGHYVAEGFGSKKSGKHAAAETAVKILKTMQSGMTGPVCNAPTVSEPKVPIVCNSTQNPDCGPRKLKDLVIYENALNPVCTLNDTAQLNQINIGYEFDRALGLNWRCKVFIDQQFIAEAVGPKKTVKHEAAEAAVNVLKKTQPVVVNNQKNGPIESAISRQQIRGLSNDTAYKQQIKEDNIGNRLLRKMGWTGGGLGKEGEGIAEPITVKEQFTREGLGLLTSNQKITRRDIEQIIRNYAASTSQDDLTFSRELTNDERKQIHQIAQRYGLRSKSYGQGNGRFLVVGRKITKQALIDRLKEQGQCGSYALVMPQN